MIRISGRLLTGLLLAALAAGCNSSPNFNLKGRVVKGGQPFHTESGEGLRIFFAPEAGADGHYESYAAIFNAEDGTFEVKGKDGTGLPPGKYRVGLQLMKKREDQFNGKYMGKKSPFTFEITSGSNEVVIDLDSPPAKG